MERHAVVELCRRLIDRRIATTPIAIATAIDVTEHGTHVGNPEPLERAIDRRPADPQTVATGNPSKVTTSSNSDEPNRTVRKAQVGIVVGARRDGVGSMLTRGEASLVNYGATPI